MKYILTFFFAAITAFSYSQPGRTMSHTDSAVLELKRKNIEAVGKTYPGFSVLSGNKKYDSTRLKGKVVFINFWFAACPPCIAEMEDLNRLYEKFKGNSKFEYVSFTFDSPEEIEKTRKKYNINYNIFSISREECYRLNLRNGFPVNIILDTDGIIKYVGTIDWAVISDYYKDVVYPIIERLL